MLVLIFWKGFGHVCPLAQSHRVLVSDFIVIKYYLSMLLGGERVFLINFFGFLKLALASVAVFDWTYFNVVHL